MKLKKGDEVIITGGKNKGKTGKIEQVFPKEDKVLIAGVNIYKRHAKAQGSSKPGGIIDIVKPLPIASVSLLCQHCKKPTRIGYLVTNQKKKRICKKCQGVLT
ncbi:50S ribosomal protein L24 [Candidatus Microgenomates bacterium]|nr:50S ribosomal protein L24 [Candidatus Microgenomates bacterium]MBI2622177.1 50S ribosomal protein L24 [Candidatus Microgenomates bacterium]